MKERHKIGRMGGVMPDHHAALPTPPLPAGVLPAAAALRRAATGSTVNDSPQPQVPLALGFTNTNSDLGRGGGMRVALLHPDVVQHVQEGFRACWPPCKPSPRPPRPRPSALARGAGPASHNLARRLPPPPRTHSVLT